MNVFPLTLSRTISLSISLSSFSHNSFFLSLTLSRPSTYISLLIYYSFISPPLFLFLFPSFYSFLSLFPLSFQIPFYLTLLVSLSLTLFHSSISPFSPSFSHTLSLSLDSFLSLSLDSFLSPPSSPSLHFLPKPFQDDFYYPCPINRTIG